MTKYRVWVWWADGDRTIYIYDTELEALNHVTDARFNSEVRTAAYEDVYRENWDDLEG